MATKIQRMGARTNRFIIKQKKIRPGRSIGEFPAKAFAPVKISKSSRVPSWQKA